MAVADFEVAGLRARPGTRESGWLEVARSPMGLPIGIPLSIFHGVGEGPVIVVDAAMHGDEHEGILAILKLMRELNPAKMRGTLILVPVLNGAAFEAGERGSPYEVHHYDMNRTFPGEAGGSITQRIAHSYFQEIVRKANAHVSLHGGGSVFYLEGFIIAHGVKGGDYLDLVRAIGWKRVADSPDPGTNPYQGTISDKCLEVGIPSVTAEMGGLSHRAPKQFQWSVNEHLRGLRNILIHYGLIQGEPQRPDRIHRIKRINLRARNGGLIEIAEGIDIEAPVQEGQVLLRIYGPMGDFVEECKSPWSGRVMGLPGSGLAYPGRIIANVYDVIGEI